MLPFKNITEIGRSRVCKATQSIFFITLKLIPATTPELLFTFSEKKSSFNLFIDKVLESILTFTLLIYVSNILDGFGI